ncbi:hypothetical protein Vadar_012112 [Vaccinium darrowii]|uniref:Uncharacterized protein n=1 Tax=Vaccinium darrowii TaxID=229202 RepID=A0ACB7XQ22_9ERIC|nr:hypothetical protein Vadar_012112 [Vaccinium darrowii]
MAVATSVLSTRWKQFWTLVTSLDFDDKLVLQRRTSNRAALQTSFGCFIYSVLRRVSCLDKLSLKCCQSYDVSHVNAWVAAFIKYRIKELDLSVPLKHSTDHVLHQDLFSCRTLVVLKLDDNSIKRLLLGCPVLDDLGMNECGGKDVHVIQISAPVLTKLTYCKGKERYFLHDDFLGTAVDYKIVIDTPALQYLELIDYKAEVSLVKNLSHIVKADISIAVQYDETHSKAITDLLMGISEVRYLHLYNYCPEVLFLNSPYFHLRFVLLDFSCYSLIFDRVECYYMKAVHKIDTELPIFHNLTSLVLGAGYVGWEWLSELLAKSPCLESLVFEEGYHIEYDGEEYDEDDEEEEEEEEEGEGDDKPLLWHPPQNIPSCLLLTLKVIEFEKFDGNKGDLKMVEYFLKNTEVLEKLIIRTDGTVGTCFDMTGAGLAIAEQQLEVTTKLLMLPRGSKTCQIEFVILHDDLDY